MTEAGELGGDPACWSHLVGEAGTIDGRQQPMVWTLGHGTLPAEDFVDLARGAGIARVVDVRSFPGSRRNPQYGRAAMEEWLPRAGLDYRWMPALGGRRRPDPASRHVGLRHAAFRAYADHMESTEFRDGVDELVAVARTAPTAVMCSESVWWRCHRRLLADHLVLVWGAMVLDVMHDGRAAAHVVTDAARLDGDQIVYDRVAAAS